MTDTRFSVLGLDLGAESVGWALLGGEYDTLRRIEAAGVHCFDAGVEGDYASGRDQSRAAARREARQPRRQHWRRSWRMRRLLGLLQRAGLMPAGEIRTAEQRHALLSALNATLRAKYNGASGPRAASEMLPYLLRARALDLPLESFELGRALYHLAQRRGFLSNRKGQRRGEDRSKVKADIGELRARISSAGARTLGEYFAKLSDPAARVRRQWTARDMYTEEFAAIWAAQAAHHATLTDDLRAEVFGVMFDQRPLKPQTHLIGQCELIPGHPRAAVALRIAQRFRLLQAVNNLEWTKPDGEFGRLSPAQRSELIESLCSDGDRTFEQTRTLLGLPRKTSFNLQRGGEKKIPGHRTDVALREIFGPRWDTLSGTERDEVVGDVLSFESSEALARRGRRRWGLDAEAAERLGELELEEGYSRHCRRALERLVSRMEDGTAYATARKAEFPEQFVAREPVSELPPVLKAVRDLRNPAVCRTLTEMRKVVNAIIRKYGKPDVIRIELSRDLKRSRQQRADLTDRMRKQESARAAAKKRILEEMHIENPSRTDIEKVLLADECNWGCPYTGRQFTMQALLGRNPEFDIEHILPLGRSFDNSFANKTLCFHEENRARKRNHTPFEAYGANEANWNQILERVRRFRGVVAREKLRRFMMMEVPEDFTARQLNDTRYASRLAKEYVGLLYGGEVDANGTRRVQAGAGSVTAFLRNEWMLNSILNDGGEKTRDDHRHHAVDAIAIALTAPSVVKKLADAADGAAQAGRRLFAPVPTPWESFLEDVRKIVRGTPEEALSGILVSRRLSHKLNGPLHAETLYSKPIVTADGEERRVRKELHKLSRADVRGDGIVDAQIRRLIQEKVGDADPAKVFADPKDHPRIRTGDGRQVSVHKVRVRVQADPWKVGTGARERWVKSGPGSNHHTVIVARVGPDGQEERWEGHPVSRFEILQRLRRCRGCRQCRELFQREWGPGRVFKFILAADDYVLMRDAKGREQLFLVQKFSKDGEIEFRLHSDARTDDQRKKERVRARAADKLRTLGARKVSVTYLGELRRAK